jgi:hypothetical protein
VSRAATLGVVCAAALGGGVAGAHPIEPLLTESPMPTPRDTVNVDSSYSAMHGGGATEQGAQLAAALGIGGRAELTLAGSFDFNEGTVGAAIIGARVLVLMEGPHGIDLALQAAVSTDHAAEGAVLAGRSVAPGFYLQGRLTLAGAAAPADNAVAVGFLSTRVDSRPLLLHVGLIDVESRSVALEGAAALQWAPTPRLLPTLEVTWRHGFAGDGSDDALVAPEAIFLLDMNHLSIKAAIPIGLTGATDVGVIVGLNWQG